MHFLVGQLDLSPPLLVRPRTIRGICSALAVLPLIWTLEYFSDYLSAFRLVLIPLISLAFIVTGVLLKRSAMKKSE